MPKSIDITRDIDGRQEIEKLVSLNPDQYEWRELHQTLKDYADYCYRAGYSRTEQEYKTFQEWLTTEI